MIRIAFILGYSNEVIINRNVKVENENFGDIIQGTFMVII